jgi:hypothetical protein
VGSNYRSGGEGVSRLPGGNRRGAAPQARRRQRREARRIETSNCAGAMRSTTSRPAAPATHKPPTRDLSRKYPRGVDCRSRLNEHGQLLPHHSHDQYAGKRVAHHAAEAAFVGVNRDFVMRKCIHTTAPFSKVNAPITHSPSKGQGRRNTHTNEGRTAHLAAGCRCESTDANARYQRRRPGRGNTPAV